MTTYAEYNERKVQLDLVEWPDPIVVTETALTDSEIIEFRALLKWRFEDVKDEPRQVA